MRTMINILLVFLATAFCSCKSQNKKIENFEGRIEYSIVYPLQKKTLTDEVTVKFKIYYKNGNIRKEYRNSKDSLLFYTIYLLDKNANYGFKPGDNTVTFYKTIYDSTVIREKLNSQSPNMKILGYECSQYKVQIRTSSEEPPSTYTFYTSEELKVNSIFKDDIMNFIFAKNSSIVLRYDVNYPVVKIVTATKIFQGNVDDNLFNVDLKNKTIKPI